MTGTPRQPAGPQDTGRPSDADDGILAGPAPAGATAYGATAYGATSYGATSDGATVPTGTAADETVDEVDVREDAAASADDTALAEAGLPAEGEPAPAPARASLAHRLYNGEAGLDVVGRRKSWYRVTAVLVLLCLLAMVVRGFNFGIDFAGGNSIRVPATQSQLVDVREAAEEAGAEVASAQVVGGNSVLLRTSELDNDTEDAVVAAVAQAAGVDRGEVSPQSVSADWGRDVTDQALVALVVFLIAVMLFLAVRFQPKMAVAAIVALLHDLLVTAGIYALIGFEVSPSTVIGLLTILGFSLYDTVVVFDKVDENTKDLTKSARMTYGEAANLAVNQTLMRSINTSVIALLPVAGLLFVGAGLLGVGTLKDLALVLFVGLAAGAYSSIFLATPVLVSLKEREPEQQALRKRVLARRAAEARQGGVRTEAPVASARRARGAGSRSGGGATAVVVAERPAALPERPTADVPVESPGSVGPAARPGVARTTTPRPGQRPQRGPGKKRR